MCYNSVGHWFSPSTANPQDLLPAEMTRTAVWLCSAAPCGQLSVGGGRAGVIMCVRGSGTSVCFVCILEFLREVILLGVFFWGVWK